MVFLLILVWCSLVVFSWWCVVDVGWVVSDFVLFRFISWVNSCRVFRKCVLVMWLLGRLKVSMLDLWLCRYFCIWVWLG